MNEPMTRHPLCLRAAGDHPVLLVRLSKAYAYCITPSPVGRASPFDCLRSFKSNGIQSSESSCRMFCARRTRLRLSRVSSRHCWAIHPKQVSISSPSSQLFSHQEKPP